MSQDKTKLVSIIIPVYNEKNYLKKCLNSLIGQTYRNIEILLIDDGSSDDSLSVCQRYAEIDSRVKVIHKENGGVSSARNQGISMSKGEFICFVDADDWMDIDGILLLLNRMVEDKSDFCFGVAYAVGAIKNELYGVNQGMTVTKDDIKGIIKYSDVLQTELGPWAKLFRKSVITNNNLCFPIDIAYGEDKVFLWQYLEHCKVLSAIPETVYYYSQLNPSRACGKYYELTCDWLSFAVSCFSKFLGNDEMFRLTISTFAMKQFDVCIRHYVNHIDDSNLDQLHQKIEHTYNKFSDYFLEDIEKESIFQELHSSMRKCYMTYFKEKDCNRLIKDIRDHNYIFSTARWKRLIRNAVAFIKRVIIY